MAAAAVSISALAAGCSSSSSFIVSRAGVGVAGAGGGLKRTAALATPLKRRCDSCALRRYTPGRYSSNNGNVVSIIECRGSNFRCFSSTATTGVAAATRQRQQRQELLRRAHFGGFGFASPVSRKPLHLQRHRHLGPRDQFPTSKNFGYGNRTIQRTIITSSKHNSRSTSRTTSTLLYNSTATPTRHPILRLLSQSMQHTLLKPRSLPLPRYISPQHFSFTLSECFGHSSFILVAASYATSDFLELRIMAVLGSTSMLFFTYFHPHGRVLWLPLKWNLLFIAINSYRIGKVLFDRYMAGLMSEELKEFREGHLSAVGVVDYYKLVRIAKEEVFEEGDLVLHQGQANPFIRIVLEGELEVLRDGTLTYVLEKGNFVSEAGLHSGLMLKGTIESCASIVVGPPFDPTGNNNLQTNKKNRVRCLRWNREELMELLESDKGLQNALLAALSWDIVRKLKMQRHMLTEGRVKDPTAWTKKREDQGISRYASILQNMLQHPEEFGDMSEVLTKYRRIHRIDDRDHERALAKCGWTEEEFRLGKRRVMEEEEDLDEEEFFENERWRRVKRYSSKLVRSLLQ